MRTVSACNDAMFAGFPARAVCLPRSLPGQCPDGGKQARAKASKHTSKHKPKQASKHKQKRTNKQAQEANKQASKHLPRA